MKIFIQMVSYRENIVNTMRECIVNASNKDNISFGVCLQQDEDVPEELVHERIKINKISWSQSKGHGWALRQAQNFYNGEDYTMLVDSKAKFAKDWDKDLIESLESINSFKPLITNFPARFIQNESPTVAYKPVVYQFVESPYVWPSPMKGVNQLIPINWISGFFFFTRGSHCVECPYDPNLYYSEIESNLTLRSYCLGYDLYCHHKPVILKDYSPSKMNWQDDSEWWLKDRFSKNRFKDLLENKISEKELSLSNIRSLKDFEIYSGIDFLGKRLNRFAASGASYKYENEDQWQSQFQKDHVITVSWDVNEIEKCDDYDYWYFSIEDDKENTLYRNDLRPDREKDIFSFNLNYRKIFFKTQWDKVPAKLCIWPVSKSKGWLKKSKFNL